MNKEQKIKILHDLKKIAMAIGQLIRDLDMVETDIVKDKTHDEYYGPLA